MQKIKYRKRRMNEMGILGFTAIIVCITAVIATAVSIAKKNSGSKFGGNAPLSKETVLENAFGSHMYMDTVKLEHITAWVKERKALLDSGAQALVMKVTPENLKKLGVTANLQGMNEQFLIIAVVMKASQSMEDSILIKYDRLDDQLEQILAKGDGSLVVNG